MKLSVIICTHNPREDFLRRTLDALEKQTLERDQWELLLVDNASALPLSAKWDLSRHPRARHVREDELGLTPARLRGILETQGELLVFVDDDNLLDEKFLETALGIAARMPNLGCFGAGLLEPEFEEAPSRDLTPYTEMLALRAVEKAIWSNVPEDDASLPWGAGLVVTRPVADAYRAAVLDSKIRCLLDRRGSELNSCGDNEFSWIACSLGMGKGIFPELKLVHLIGRRRVQHDYLVRIAEGHAYSRTLLNWVHGVRIPPPVDPPLFSDVLKALCAVSPSRFFHAGSRWWHERSFSPIEREFKYAGVAGVKRALELLKTFNA
jgi:glycosyltransferase involved in cell wall biosynthesis